jgi:hypothetical protein
MTRWLSLCALLGLSTPALGQDSDDLRDSAWTSSVAAEAAGDRSRAEAILIRAWGEAGGNYFVQLRRAYLALMQGRFSEAETRYAALQSSEEGASDPDVAAGLRAARAGTVPPGDASAASVARAVPEVWGAFVGQTLGTTRYLGGAVFAHVPVRMTSELRLHVAGRYVGYQRQGGGSAWAFGQAGTRQLSIGDAFVGADYQRLGWGVDVVGVYETITRAGGLAGGGLRARLGRQLGILLDGSMLASTDASANWQAAPQVFFWPLATLGLRAGARLTYDGHQSNSVMAGASAFILGHAVHVDGHLGSERAALNPVSFSLLNLAGDATLGGSVTAIFRLSQAVHLLAQGQGERLKNDGAEGAYWSASIGVDMALGSL